MTYAQTLQFLFTRLPMFSRIGAAAYKADLENTITLCKHLDNPEKYFKSIHVAGTNGKGSVSHMLAAVFQSAGYRTGLYTSPHIKDFRERIKVNGKMIGEDFIVDFTERIKPLIDDIEPSFFEITVAMAFDYFRNEEVEIAIIETGLGGRLDSTNVITPELSIITNIGMDHMNLLGDSLEKIAFEKAGIIKKGVPVVVGEILEETLPVFKKTAANQEALLSIASEKRQVADWKWENHELLVEVSEKNKTDHDRYQLDLQGLYQLKNLLTVIESIHQLKQIGWNIDEKAVHEGLKHVKKLTGLHGRWETIHQSPTIVLDAAHNADGIRQLVRQIELTDHHALHIILGFVRDKDIDHVLSLLPSPAHYYFTQADIPRALEADTLWMLAKVHGLKGNTYSNVNDALSAARTKAQQNDLIIICGSIFILSEVVPPSS
jgi:dihydrofolate synthase/folylpolyglutamate synthase